MFLRNHSYTYISIRFYAWIGLGVRSLHDLCLVMDLPTCVVNIVSVASHLTSSCTCFGLFFYQVLCVCCCSSCWSDAHRSFHSLASEWRAQLWGAPEQTVYNPDPNGHTSLHWFPCWLTDHCECLVIVGIVVIVTGHSRNLLLFCCELNAVVVLSGHLFGTEVKYKNTFIIVLSVNRICFVKMRSCFPIISISWW